ncbi:MAG TPA: hypothetical protein VNO32_36330, partial [Candidatus Acidoferrum sp.]|nr:hypothetical protein [Candidatus Acidoferrum sp.]
MLDVHKYKVKEITTRMACLRLILLALTLGCLSTTTRAQDRMPEIPADKLTEAQKKAVAEFVAGRGTPPLGPFI